MTYLYAVQMNILGYPFQPIKIGRSTNPNKRMKAYMSGPFPTTWLGSWEVEDGAVAERKIHIQFQKFRLVGEWFYPSAGLKRFVEIKVGLPIDAIMVNQPSRETVQFQERFVRLFPDGSSSIEKEWGKPGRAKPCSARSYHAATKRLDALEASSPLVMALRESEAKRESADVH